MQKRARAVRARLFLFVFLKFALHPESMFGCLIGLNFETNNPFEFSCNGIY